MALTKASSPRRICLSSSEEGDLLKNVSTTAKIKSVNQQDGKGRKGRGLEDLLEYVDLVEKILQTIDVTFSKDDLIDEFDIVPVESKSNHSPVLYDDVEHKLALESWCVPYLFAHSYRSFLEIRRRQKKKQPSNSSSPRRNGYPEISSSNMLESHRIEKGFQLSRVLVLLNPDLTVAWNFRKDYVVVECLEDLKKELGLARLVATRKPKCPEAYAYRRWLLSKAVKCRLILQPSSDLEFILKEFTSVETPITRYFANYHAWDHRLWLLNTVCNTVSQEERNLVLQSEKEFTDEWMKRNVSDYCGHNYRERVLTLLVKNKSVGFESPSTVLQKELLDNSSRIRLYEGHEVLWYYRRALLKLLCHLLPCQPVHSNNVPSSAPLENEAKDAERKFIALILNNVPKDKKEDSKPGNFALCNKHVTWINAHLPEICLDLESE